MKMKIRLCALLLLMATSFSVFAAASAPLSPAIAVLSKENRLIKSGLVGSDIYFSESDFLKCLGVPKIDAVTVSELPSASTGLLKLGTLVISEGQSIGASYLSLLRFVPADSVKEAKCIFACGATEIPCTIKIVDKLNYAPTFAETVSKVSTYKEIACFGRAGASDPDGDALHFEVVSYPSHGSLQITDASRGNFCYVPQSGYVGKDTFTLVVRDDFGNYSTPQTVQATISKTKVSFTDAHGHWCENAAISLCEDGIISPVRYGDSSLLCPAENVSREEFVMMTMKAVGIATLTDSVTTFADNAEISIECRPYIATAQRMGYIGGKDVDGVLCFMPKENITRAEVAVLLQNILDYETPDTALVFADDGAIPTWAKTAVYALSAAGVFNGSDGSILPSALLSRAETVQLLYNIRKK